MDYTVANIFGIKATSHYDPKTKTVRVEHESNSFFSKVLEQFKEERKKQRSNSEDIGVYTAMVFNSCTWGPVALLYCSTAWIPIIFIWAIVQTIANFMCWGPVSRTLLTILTIVNTSILGSIGTYEMLDHFYHCDEVFCCQEWAEAGNYEKDPAIKTWKWNDRQHTREEARKVFKQFKLVKHD